MDEQSWWEFFRQQGWTDQQISHLFSIRSWALMEATHNLSAILIEQHRLEFARWLYLNGYISEQVA